eukprot:2431153-Pyramimonas_sp.AAC.1
MSHRTGGTRAPTAAPRVARCTLTHGRRGRETTATLVNTVRPRGTKVNGGTRGTRGARRRWRAALIRGC